MKFRVFEHFSLLIFATFFCVLYGKSPRLREPEVQLLDGYRSPLDDGFPPDYYYSSGEESSNNGVDSSVVNNSVLASELPLCQKACLSKFSDAAKAALQSSSNYERYKGVCHNYNLTVRCMDKLEGEVCSNQETFHVLTSGLRYICIEQHKAFEAVIECIDAQTDEVEKECEGVCHVKERMAHWAVQSGVLDNFMQGALSSLANGETFASQMLGRESGISTFGGTGLHRNAAMLKAALEGATRAAAVATAEGIKTAAKAAAKGNAMGGVGGGQLSQPQKTADGAAAAKAIGGNLFQKAAPLSKRISPEFMKAVIQDGCELARCQLICIRVKFDAKCGGSAGTLLSEAFVRPISQAQEFLSYGSIAPFMGAFLPHQCDFMVKKKVLNEFRIPPELDDALHHKYDVGNSGKGEGDGEAVIGGQKPIDNQNHTQGNESESHIIEKVSNSSQTNGTEMKEPLVPAILPNAGNNKDNFAESGERQLHLFGFGKPTKMETTTPGKFKISPGDINSVSHVVGRTSPRKGPRKWLE